MSNIIALLLRPRETRETRSNNIPFTTFSFNRFFKERVDGLEGNSFQRRCVVQSINFPTIELKKKKQSLCISTRLKYCSVYFSLGKISDNDDLMIVLVSVPQDSHAL